MTLDKAVLSAVGINIFIYVAAMFIPCRLPSAFIDFCGGVFNPLRIGVAFAIQFPTDLNFVSLPLTLLIWSLVVLPFFFWYLTKDHNK